jgi:hypothetical protein
MASNNKLLDAARKTAAYAVSKTALVNKQNADTQKNIDDAKDRLANPTEQPKEYNRQDDINKLPKDHVIGEIYNGTITLPEAVKYFESNKLNAGNEFKNFDWSKIPAASMPTADDLKTGKFNYSYLPTDIPLPFQTSDGTKQMTTDEFRINSTLDDLIAKQTASATAEKGLRDTATVDLEKYLTDQNKNLYGDLSQSLSKSADQTFNYELPDMLEGLNSQGLFGGGVQSLSTGGNSALANAMAREKANLEAQKESKLGEYQVNSGTNIANLLAQAKMANTAEDVNSLKSGFDLNNEYSSAALNRGFSTQDWNKEAALSKELAAMGIPNTQKDSNFDTALSLTNPMMYASKIMTLGKGGGS